VELEFGTIEENLERALGLAASWHAVYLASGPRERRQMNQAIFERLYILPDESIQHQYARPFAILLGKDVERAVTRRYLRTTDAHNSIDEEWRELAAKRAADLDPVLQGAENRNPRATAAVGGLNMTFLVGAEGLEPPASAL
jgi:transglutaminase-like putative cysteine protease